MPMVHACGDAMREVGDRLGACARCRVLVPRAGEPMLLPAGFDVASAIGSDPLDAEVRGPVLERRWSARFGCIGAFLVVWGLGLAGGSIFAVTMFVADGERAHGLLPLVAIAAIGLLGLYVGVADLSNRTRLTISRETLVRRDGPLRWRETQAWTRREGDRVLERAVSRNDLRNGTVRWPAPTTAEVAIVDARGERALVLFDQMDATHARTVARILSAVLDAVPVGRALLR
jgi:hypothetical protein